MGLLYTFLYFEWKHTNKIAMRLSLSAIMKWHEVMLQSIYNPITAMGFLEMFTFQLDNTKR